MKKVLSLLMAVVFMHTQAHALSGGPLFAGGTSISLTGLYSGVLTGPPNSLGIFVVGIPDVGAATGDFSIFINGGFYGGSIIGIADPQDATFRGAVNGELVSASSFVSDLFFGFSAGTEVIEGTAAGLVDAEVVDSGGAFGGISATRLEGTARVDVRERAPDQVVTDANGNDNIITGQFVLVASLDFTVDGFKQSADPQANAQQNLLQGFGGGGGNGG